ncbi:hypothetical protein BC936DRAFT_144614 [Jimgerdemannia flammicorona]|uniref:Uncharacterized protein n=1 Tax=Jimgerdemannia flammicorona TaxID=994334 RepID=A0A433DC38_9FUNG|nr:hypothetical protein BC936DRAFT_144614 [Jimgerdemannia flammicorona]
MATSYGRFCIGADGDSDKCAFPELRSQNRLALWLALKGNTSSPAGHQSPIAEVGLPFPTSSKSLTTKKIQYF